jgi:hypothetical protein
VNCFRTVSALLCILAALLALHAGAQSAGTDASAVATSTSTQNLVRWTGSAPQEAGRTVEMSFALYEDQAGGLPLWRETQQVNVGGDGRYTVLLGAASGEGIPPALFHASEARWIEARPIGTQRDSALDRDAAAEAANITQPRSLLAAVPYAFKSIDAESLDGRAAEEYVTREDLQATVDRALADFKRPELPGERETPSLKRPILPAGPGADGHLPLWTGASSLGSSVITQFGQNVGIGTSSPATLLDVNGASTLRAAVSLLASAATLAAGVNSPALQLGASTYSSASDTAMPQNFAWQAQSTGNNTNNPGANLALLFGSGDALPAPTGLSIASNGQITFAPGQTFPGMSINPGVANTANSITSVAAGPGLTGGGSSGNVTLALAAPISTANGGTGATTATQALANLGAVSARQIGGLTQADQDGGADFGQKVVNCLTAAMAAGSNICDARNLTGAQSLSANLVFTANNASHMTLLLAGNVTVNQGSYQVLIQPGVTGFSVTGAGAWGTQGASGQAGGTTFRYSGSDYAWKVVGGVPNTWTYYIKLQDFAISVAGPGAASGLYLGPEVEDVYLERMRIALPTSGSAGFSLHMFGGVAGSNMYSSFAHIDAPEFVGGAGVLVDGSGLAAWGQSKAIGGRIMASSSSIAGSYCVNQVAGELSMVDTDLENCDIGLHIMDSNTVHPYVHPDGCCVNTGVQLDGPSAQNNYVVTTSTNNSQINGARWNTVNTAGGSTIYNDLGAGGSTISNYQYADVPINQVIASGKTKPQYTNLYLGDGSTGVLTNYWNISKDDANGFEIGDMAARTNRLQFSPGANGNTALSANGAGAVSFNWASGTGGVVFGNGAGASAASISSAGMGTFNGVTDTEVTGSPQCAQFNSAGVLSGTGTPCASSSPAAAVAPVRWTFVGFSPAGATGGPFGRYTPDVDVTVISEEYTFYGQPTGCTTYPTMYLADNGTAIPGSTRTLNAIGGSYTGLTLNVAAGDTLSVMTAPGTGCTGQNSGVFTITMKPKGSD